ncbi:MAG: hypothetical protein CSB24_03590, partial [Deltaproteobacteria bacterium]
MSCSGKVKKVIGFILHDRNQRQRDSRNDDYRLIEEDEPMRHTDCDEGKARFWWIDRRAVIKQMAAG